MQCKESYKIRSKYRLDLQSKESYLFRSSYWANARVTHLDHTEVAASLFSVTHHNDAAVTKAICLV